MMNLVRDIRFRLFPPKESYRPPAEDRPLLKETLLEMIRNNKLSTCDPDNLRDCDLDVRYLDPELLKKHDISLEYLQLHIDPKKANLPEQERIQAAAERTIINPQKSEGKTKNSYDPSYPSHLMGFYGSIDPTPIQRTQVTIPESLQTLELGKDDTFEDDLRKKLSRMNEELISINIAERTPKKECNQTHLKISKKFHITIQSKTKSGRIVQTFLPLEHQTTKESTYRIYEVKVLKGPELGIKELRINKYDDLKESIQEAIKEQLPNTEKLLHTDIALANMSKEYIKNPQFELYTLSGKQTKQRTRNIALAEKTIKVIHTPIYTTTKTNIGQEIEHQSLKETEISFQGEISHEGLETLKMQFEETIKTALPKDEQWGKAVLIEEEKEEKDKLVFKISRGPITVSVPWIENAYYNVISHPKNLEEKLIERTVVFSIQESSEAELRYQMKEIKSNDDL